MQDSPAHNNESMEKHLEHLASIIERHQLSHLEYEFGGTRIVLGKKPARQKMPWGLARANEVASVSAASADALTVAPADALATAPAGASTATTSNRTSLGTLEQSALGEQDGHVVNAPLIGIAYRSKEPGAKAFVSEGDAVKEGDVLCLIEAMKMFNEVKAPVAGTVRKIHFEDASLVEFGAALFTIK